MKPAENIERSIKNLHDTTSSEMDERILKDILPAIEQTKTKPNIWRIVAGSRITQLAAVVVIITSLCFIIFHASINGHSGNGVPGKVQLNSTTGMMSVLTINRIYHQGGFDAVQRHFDKINELKGPRQRHTVTLYDILAELNGDEHERKKL